MPIFKGPLFASHRKAKRTNDTFTAIPVAHGNIDAEDFAAMKSGRPTRKDLEIQRKDKESKEDA